MTDSAKIETIRAFVKYLYWLDKDAMRNAFYPGATDDYVTEKWATFQTNPLRWYGQLDKATEARVVAIAVDPCHGAGTCIECYKLEGYAQEGREILAEYTRQTDGE